MNHTTHFDLGVDGRVIIITGGASGIGAAAVTLLAQLGAHVIAGDLDPAGLAALHVASGSHGTITTLVGDLSIREGCAALVAEALRKHGRIDGLVCAAGIVRADDPNGPGSQDYDPSMAINVRGIIEMLAAVKPAMIAQRAGSIVVLGSVVAHLGWAHRAVYCATKGAVHALARSAAVELLPHGIRVNVIAPGLVWTPMIQAVVARAADPSAAFRARCAEQGNGRMLRDVEVARAVLYFISPWSSPATGCIHDLSVGRTIGFAPSPERPGPEFLSFAEEAGFEAAP